MLSVVCLRVPGDNRLLLTYAQIHHNCITCEPKGRVEICVGFPTTTSHSDTSSATFKSVGYLYVLMSESGNCI